MLHCSAICATTTCINRADFSEVRLLPKRQVCMGYNMVSSHLVRAQLRILAEALSSSRLKCQAAMRTSLGCANANPVVPDGLHGDD